MSEIEQLQKDIATLEAARNQCIEIDQRHSKQLNIWADWNITSELKAKLAKLEAEAAAKADPWENAKWQAKNLGNDGKPDIYNYANRLEQRVAELEKQLASEKQRAADFDLASHCLSSDLKKAQTRIAELEAELARRPVVWCAKFKSGEMVEQTTRDADRCYREHTALYRSQSLAQGIHPDLQIEPYTGQQS